MSVDIVIVTFNSGERILRCLEHLGAQTASHSICVVDNDSQDGTVERIARFHPGVRIVRMGRNAGFSAAMNAGAQAGDGEIVVTLNDDIEAAPTFVEAITAPFEGDPAVGMVAALTTIPGRDLVDSLGIEVDATLTAYNRLSGRPIGSVGGAVAAPMGGCGAYRRTAFEAVGGFDERFFSYGEDLDLGLRIRAAGWRLAAAPEARAVHLGGATWDRYPVERLRQAGFGRGLVLRRYGVLRGAAAPRALLVELLTAVHNLLTRRTFTPVRSRIAGWRAAGPARSPVDPAAIEHSISLREQIARMRG
jgi:N-acetylglucosaminyl-diphospho-decaprenol L-rhamnosyltransferase